MSHTPSENPYGPAANGYSTPGQSTQPEAPRTEHTSPFPTAENHIVAKPDNRPYPGDNQPGGYSNYTNYPGPHQESFNGTAADTSWAWTSFAALASSVVNFLVALIPFFNFLIVPFTGLVTLVFVIMAFIGVSERKNDKKGTAIAATCLLFASVFAFIFSYLFLGLVSSI